MLQIKADGVGTSIKDAKHAAAAAFIDKYCNSGDYSDSDDPQSPESFVHAFKEVEGSHVFQGTSNSENFVGDLQELCGKAKVELPLYELETEAEYNYGREFIMLCSLNVLGGLSTLGTGSRKKIAKQQAAKAMLKLLRIKQNDSGAFDSDDDF